MKAICTADQHFDKGSHLHPGRLAEQEENWRTILRLAREHQVDAVLHAGDAFDSRRPDQAAMLAFERPLVEHRDQGGCRVVAINGNGSHDAPVGETPSPLRVFHEAGLLELHQEPALVEVAGTTVACLPWAPVAHLRAQLGADHDIDNVNAAVAELLVTIARDLREQILGPAVLLTHFSVSGSLTPEGASVDLFREPILDLHDLAALGFDAVVLGHIHRRQVLNEQPPVFYVGSPMPLSFGEGGFEHGVYLLDTDDPEFGLRFIELDSPRFLTFDLDPDYGPGVGEVGGAYVRARIVASEDEAREIDARAIERALVGEGALYAKVELQVERAVRARVDQLDETVTEADAFQLWLDANHVDAAVGRELAALDVDYRERVAA